MIKPTSSRKLPNPNADVMKQMNLDGLLIFTISLFPDISAIEELGQAIVKGKKKTKDWQTSNMTVFTISLQHHLYKQ